MNQLRWQDAVNLVLGAWLAGSPWILGFAIEMPAAMWNALVVALLIVLLAATDLDAPASWEEWALGAFGLWLVVAPWSFGYAANSAMTSSSVVTGALVMALAAWRLYVAGGFPHRRGTAH
jgi:hypothetical protein